MSEQRPPGFRLFEDCSAPILHALETLGGHLPAYLSALVMAQHMDVSLGPSEIRQELADMSPATPEGVLPSERSIAHGLIKLHDLHALLPIDIETIDLAGRLSAWGAGYLLPLAGVLLMNQAACPELSQLKLWGIPAPPQDMNRIPSSRFGVVRLLEMNPEGISNTDIQEVMGKTYATAQKEVAHLKRLGIVTVARRNEKIMFDPPHEWTYLLEDGVRAHMLVAGSEALYESQGKTEATQEEFLEAVRKFYPSATKRQVREAIAYREKRGQRFIRQARTVSPYQKHTVTLTEEWRPMVGRLVAGIVGLTSGENRQAAAAQIQGLTTNADAMDQLLRVNEANVRSMIKRRKQ